MEVTSMSVLKRREVAVFMTALAGIAVIADYFLKVPILNTAVADLLRWGVILASFMLIWGTISMIRVHANVIRKKTPNQWYYSVWLVFLMVVFVAVSLIQGLAGPSSRWMYDSIYVASSSTYYSILGFYMISASYRAIRARSGEATLLLVIAVIIMLMNAPIGAAVWEGIPALGKWIVDVPNTAASRGYIIGLAIGAVILGVRTLAGRERGYLG